MVRNTLIVAGVVREGVGGGVVGGWGGGGVGWWCGFFFFFQAEDGIRDWSVTGVQTCALPILVPVTSDNRIPFLQTNKVDLVISSMGANPERAKSIFFSIPYAPFFSGLYGSSDISDVGGFGDLGSYKVGVTQGTLEDLELTDAVDENVQIERFADNSLTASSLISGQVDLIATGNVVAAELSKNNPDKNIEGKFIIKESPAHIGLRRGEVDLLQWVNTFVYHKRLGGELDDFSKKWLGEPLPPLPAF